MPFTVEKHGKIVASFEKKNALAEKVKICPQHVIDANGYRFFHVTKRSKSELFRDGLLSWLHGDIAKQRAKKEQTHKQILVSEGVTGWHKKKVWVRK